MELLVIADVSGPDTYHVGDEAMLEANLCSLRRFAPGVTFTVISSNPEWTSAYYNVKSLPPVGFPQAGDEARNPWEALLGEALSLTDDAGGFGSRVEPRDFERPQSSSRPSERSTIESFRGRCRQTLDALGRSDGLVVSGGGNLCSTWPHHLYERLALIFMAHRLGKPIVLLGQTIGPHLRPQEHSRLASALRLADIVVTRERPSFELALAMGVEGSRLLYSPDDALFLAEGPVTEPGAAPVPPWISKTWIAITLTKFLDPERQSTYLESLAEQLEEIRERTQTTLAFIPHFYDAQGGFADNAMGASLASRLNGSLHVLELRSAPQVCWLTRQAHMIISNRYHPLVFGLASGVPGLGLYSDEYTRVKIEGVLAHADLSHWSLPMDAALQGALASRAWELWQQRDGVRSQLLSKEPEWKEQEKHRWRRVLQVLGIPYSGSG